MSPEVLSIAVLVAMFVAASLLPVNLGAMAFVAAWLVGSLVGGLSVEEIFSGFPAKLFILLVGVTYLFAIAQSNGTIGWLTRQGVRMVGGYVAAIPWLMFLLAAVLTSVGALSAAGVAIVAPIALRFAAQYRINSLLMGVMVVQGVTAGSFSPVSPFGVITGGVVERSGLAHSPGLLYANSIGFNTLVAVLAFLAFGGVRLMRRGKVSVQHEETAGEAPGRVERVPAPAQAAVSVSASGGTAATGPGPSTDPAQPAAAPESVPGSGEAAGDSGAERDGLTVYRAATLLGILVLVVGALAFDLDIGFLAFTIALVLAMAAPGQQKGAIKDIPWGVVLLVSGILTYVGILDKIGTIDYVGKLITTGGNELFAALAASYIGGLISAFAATAGVLGASIPLAVPILHGSALPVMGVVSAIAISSSIVDISPLSTNGALLLANQRTTEERVFFRQLLLYAVGVVAVAPVLAWLIFVVLQVP